MQENDINITIDTLVRYGQKEALIVLRDNLKADYEKAKEAVDAMSGNLIRPIAKKDDSVSRQEKRPPLYSKDWTNQEKFVYVLKSQGRFLKFREAAKIIVELEGTGDEDTITQRLSVATRHLKKEGKIVKVSMGGHANTFWGLPRWLDDNGNIKEGHEYNKEAIKGRNFKEKISSGILDDL